jgi:hypothetical protein
VCFLYRYIDTVLIFLGTLHSEILLPVVYESVDLIVLRESIPVCSGLRTYVTHTHTQIIIRNDQCRIQVRVKSLALRIQRYLGLEFEPGD